MIPADLERWLEAHFAEPQAARELLEMAVDHAGKPADARLMRCAALASHGDMERLRYYVGLMQIDYRDVIVAGEYEVRGSEWLRVRDLNNPIS